MVKLYFRVESVIGLRRSTIRGILVLIELRIETTPRLSLEKWMYLWPRKGPRLHKLDRLGKFLPDDVNVREDPKQCWESHLPLDQQG